MFENLLSYIIVVGSIVVFGILWFFEYYMTNIVYIMKHENGIFWRIKKKRLHRNNDRFVYKNREYLLCDATYYDGRKKVYVFEIKECQPLKFNIVSDKRVDSTLLNLIFKREIVKQLVKAIDRPTISLMQIIVIVVIAIVGLIILNNFIVPQPVTVTPSTTIPTIGG